MRALDKFGSAFLRLLLRRMKELGLNQSALARRMKCSRAYVSKVLSGDVSFTFATAIRFCRALELDFIPSASSSPSTSSLDLSPPTSSLHADNTIYLMHLVSRAYAHAHSLSRQEFNARDAQFNILRYVATCPSVFDALPEAEMVKEVDRYVSRRAVADRLIRKFERVDWRDFQ